ncbi:MAG: asparaginase [Polaromonas sp.]|nr:asparaginase [Polaromonas sp.]
MSDQKIVFLGTGGTIAGTAANALDHTGLTGYTAAQIGVHDLLASLPDWQEGAERYVVEQVAQLDSKDMGFDVWVKLALRVAHHLAQDDVQGIVITHGTDTLEETAYFLQALLAPSKPVVLTCAMRPANALVPDGPQNLLDALAVASSIGARGVTVVCAGAIYGAEEVQKVHPYRLNAFSAGDAGPIGFVEQGRLRLLRDWPRGKALPLLVGLADAAWPRVEIVMSYAGADGTVVRALLKSGVQGLVVVATGNGTVHQDLESALLMVMQHGVKVVRATRCAEGRLLPGVNDALPAAPGLTPVKARIALILALMQAA